MALSTILRKRSGSSLALCFYACVVGLSIFHLVNSHDHGHAHGHVHDHGHAHGHHEHSQEAASFKYSREANVEAKTKEKKIAGHGHSHEHHGHSHDHHGHSHDHHGHSHDHHGHSHDHVEQTENAEAYWQDHDTGNSPTKRNSGSLWLKALTATALISAAPVLILLFIPLQSADEHQEFLKVLLSFASGGLLGDAFLHLIPHAISPHSHGREGDHGHQHSHSHSHESHGHEMSVGLWVLAGIIAFLMVEKFVRFVKGEHSHSHGHSLAAPTSPKKSVPKSITSKSKKKDKKSDNEDESKEGDKSEGETKAKNSEKTDKGKGKAKPTGESKEGDKSEGDTKAKNSEKTDKGKDKAKPTDEKKEDGDKEGDTAEKTKEEVTVVPAHGSDIKVAGYLNLAADFAHNFTDGLAIGASFLAGHSVGIITTVTIFLHEIPHEIGDFAILVQSGCSKKKAMLLQFSTAIGAMLGTLCSLVMEDIGEAATAWILPFTAGGFIYIATVSVIPELLEDSKIGQSIKEILALLTGVYMMVLIAEYE